MPPNALPAPDRAQAQHAAPAPNAFLPARAPAAARPRAPLVPMLSAPASAPAAGFGRVKIEDDDDEMNALADDLSALAASDDRRGSDGDYLD